MNKKKIRVIALGVLCLVLNLAAVWYSVTFNESRLVVPTDFSTYVFRVQDLPMMGAVLLLTAYVFYLVFLVWQAAGKSKRREVETKVTRKVDPRLGLLGFAGFLGFLGFWTYRLDGTVTPFLFFVFFGFFGFYYDGKVSGTFMDERYLENTARAQLEASRLSLSLIFLSLLLVGSGRLMGSLEYTLIAETIIISLCIALYLFLGSYLLYRYDHDDKTDDGEEE
ncbi:MAG: DUF3796 domain-containing protein [Lawsonibacter sp.]|nr:DUF3796 domain-containing protein [Lawsonibacter sp.]